MIRSSILPSRRHWAGALTAYILTSSALAAAPTGADRLYSEGVQARIHGRLAEAISLFSQALTQQPRNADLLLQQGLAMSAAGRDAEAEQLLEQVLQIAPAYTDASVALAQIEIRRGKVDNAMVRVENLLAQRPDDLQARLMHANLLLTQGKAEQSEREYRALLQRPPDNIDALIGLGDSLRTQLRDQEARKIFQQAAAFDPGSTTAAARMALPPRPRFRIDIGAGHSHLSQDRPSWNEGSIRLAYQASSQTNISGGIDISRRFNQTDNYGQLRVDHRYTERTSGFVYAGGAPGAEFLPKLDLGLGGQYRFNRLRGPNATHGTLSMRYANYASGDVWSAQLGLIQYLASDRLWLTATSINTLDERNQFLAGYLLRADWQMRPQLRLLAGYANAPESSDGITLRTRSVFAGLVYDLTDTLGVNLTLAHEKREDLYNRNSIAAGLTYRF